MLLNKLQEFLAITPVMDKQEFLRFVLTEGEEGVTLNKLMLYVSDYPELKVVWEQNERSIVDIKPIAIQDIVLTDDGFEKSIQFVLERMPSRVIKVQIEPHLHVEFGLFWETCDEDECDE
jgi:hypothetical protein